MDIPEDHPRYLSLMARELIAEGVEKGLVDRTGLIAHGRGEAFDYIIGEATIEQALPGIRAGAGALVTAEHPIISVNGNTAVLAGRDIAELSSAHGIPIEVNLFHRTEDRVVRLVELMRSHGAEEVLGVDPDEAIPGLSHARSLCSKEGIYSADAVLVPLEDGDRALALREMGKTVIAIDLNPLSRTAGTAVITIVDNVVRAVPAIKKEMDMMSKEDALKVLEGFDNEDSLNSIIEFMADRLRELGKTIV